MRSIAALLCVVALLGGAALAQEPKFRPLPEREAKPPRKAPEDEKPAAPKGAVAETPTDPLEQQFQALARWPAKSAQEAALVLAGLGSSVEGRLIAGLRHLDWRVQAGSAMALAHAKSEQALPAIAAALEEDANRMAAPDMMRAAVAIDPKAGSEVVWRHLRHPNARMRAAARRALPDRLDPSFQSAAVVLSRDRKGSQRLVGLQMLARVPGAQSLDDWFEALADPEPRVAAFAAEQIAKAELSAVSPRLLRLSAEGPTRQAAYAFLSLTTLEDLTGVPVVPEQGATRERAEGLLRTEDPFHRTAAAILLANLAHRATDPSLHELADRVLFPTILSGVAAGVFYSDYTSVGALGFAKLGLLSGESIGNDAPKWREAWLRLEPNFKARRRLSGVSAEALLEGRIVAVFSQARGAARIVHLVGEGVPGDAQKDALILDGPKREALAKAMAASDFFAQNQAGSAERAGEERLELRVRLESRGLEHRRSYDKPYPGQISGLADLFLEIARDLSWQRFLPKIADAGERERLERALQGAGEASLRRSLIAEMALKAFGALAASDRPLATAAFLAAPRGFVAERAKDFAALLTPALGLSAEARDLISLLQGEDSPEVVTAVLDHFAEQVESARSEVFASYLARAGRTTRDLCLNARRGWMRAMALESEVRTRESVGKDLMDRLIQAIGDPDIEVRRAAVFGLSRAPANEAGPILLRLIEGEDLALKLRAMEAYGEILQDESIPLLRNAARADDARVRWAAVRALGFVQTAAGLDALAAVIRETGPLEIRREAVERLAAASSASEPVLAELLDRVREAAVRLDLMSAYARVAEERALPKLNALAKDEDPEVARTAVLLAAPLGELSAQKMLLAWMSELEGDLAAERALERLTFFVTEDSSPPRRHAAHQDFAETHGERSRSEWFALAAGRAGVPLDGRVDWLSLPTLDAGAARNLVRLVRTGNRPLRLEADRILRRQSDLGLAPLPEDADAFALAARAEAFESWIQMTLAREP